MIYSIILVFLVFFLGYFAKLERKHRFSLGQSLVLVGVFLFLGVIMFGSIFSIVLISLDNLNIENLFVIMFTIALIIGFVLYWLLRFVIVKLKINSVVIALSEYIIQWGLIYITIYQTFFSSILKNKDSIAPSLTKISDPSEILIFVLPSLIALWIAVVLYRVRDGKIS